MKKENLNINKFIIISLLLIIIFLLIVIIIKFLKDNDKGYKNNYYRGNQNVENIPSKEIENDKNNDSSNIDRNKYISRQQAINIVLKDVGVNQNQIYDLEIELDYKYNQVVYEIDFDYQQFEYEYYINAENGNIVKSFKEWD